MTPCNHSRFLVFETVKLCKLLKNKDLSLGQIALQLDRTKASIRQKITELAVQNIKQGDSMSKVIDELRVEEEDVELLLSAIDPRIQKIKELVDEVQVLLRPLK